MSFHLLGLSARMRGAILRAGFEQPTPIQEKSIPLVLAGGDLIGIAQTGTGKTAAFALPILDRLAAGRSLRSPRALVLAPTRELAAQIAETFTLFSRGGHLRTTTIFGGVGERPQISSLRRGTDILVATPGRLLDLADRGEVDFSAIETLVLDEADRMLDMGFLPQIRRIIRQIPTDRQTLMFSATLSREIETMTREFQRSPERVEIGRRNDPAATVVQTLYPVVKSRKVDLLLHLLENPELESVLVFSRTKHGADKISRKIERTGIATERIHSNRSQSQRTSALARFRSGRSRVLVATDIAARGIDVEGISHVINFDFPPAPEDYIHRIGRTGRADSSGIAISFVTSDDHASVRSLEKTIRKNLDRRSLEEYSGPIVRTDPALETHPRKRDHANAARPMRRRRRRSTRRRHG
ncbi:MAG: DEAD/DEAH box helicase [Thermoanaerobaculia bacterium]|nr:DEAD/DEAH box helicase [Thermoanaerobaculia bacterium]